MQEVYSLPRIAGLGEDDKRPLAKVNFRPLAPQFWGEPKFKVPQDWGASAVLGSPQVEHLAWI